MFGLFAQESGPVVQTLSGRSYVLDVLIVLVLVGAALFAVCRSSRRT
ncbi:MAG TPA: hypothetical protein VML55_01700 [Planctomycetaceae bacterium]|nr:hypothetical protein [Planctomycetaceae bacterium]